MAAASSPERIAAAAREHEGALSEALAWMADGIAEDLAARFGMVAWEREEQIGAAQRALYELAELRFGRITAKPPARVRELREQPLDSLAVAWGALRRGRRVHVESESGACPGAYRVLRELAELLGEDMLGVSPPGAKPALEGEWEAIGVEAHRPRVALLQADADPELAAYVLARACLRRTGFDPRVVHHVVIVGPHERLQRNLRRLWVGARMGPVDDERAFAGPVSEARAEAFFEVERRFREREGVTTICAGEALQVAGAERERFLAPALFRAPAAGQGEDGLKGLPAPCGPMLVMHPMGGDADARERGEARLVELAGEGGVMRFGQQARELRLRGRDRQVHGALLVERLPPGLPEPRP